MYDEWIADGENDQTPQIEGGGEVHAIGDVLAELLAQYQARFPDVRIAVIETPSAAA